MCGIAGYLVREGDPPDDAILQEMADVLAHRGPDGGATHAGRLAARGAAPAVAIGLAHRRLAILDREGGAQPMATANGRFRILYNGEVYNHAELRAGLESEGVPFRTRCDTEVVLEMYRRHGPAMLGRLRGMFALAVWDRRERTLFLARDRFGQKPLVYHDDGRRFAFASETKALLRLPWVRREPALEHLPLYLGLGYVPSPRSPFRGIRKLPPGHCLLWKAGRTRVRRYYDIPPLEPFDGTRRQATAAVREAVEEATRLRLGSDVPLGAFLSGGIDSSVVAASMATASGARAVETFCVGFREAAFDERPHAEAVAAAIGARHRSAVTSADAFDLLPRLAWFLEEPFADSSALPTYLLAGITRRHVTVALSGDGGDETFGGYARYRGMLIADALDRRLPWGLRRAGRRAGREVSNAFPGAAASHASRFLDGLADHSLDRYARWVGVFPPEMTRRMLRLPPAPTGADRPTHYLWPPWAESGASDPAQHAMDVDLHTYLPEDLLVKVDRMTMAHSLECRSPLLDHPLVELAARLPRPWRLDALRSKTILRDAFRDRLPAATLARRKHGFGVPVDRWLRGPAGARAEALLTDERTRRRGLLRPGAVRRLLGEHRRGGRSHGARIWSLLMMEMWFRLYLDASPSLEPPDEPPMPWVPESMSRR